MWGRLGSVVAHRHSIEARVEVGGAASLPGEERRYVESTRDNLGAYFHSYRRAENDKNSHADVVWNRNRYTLVSGTHVGQRDPR